MRGCKLFGDRLTAHACFRGGDARRLHSSTRIQHALLGSDTLLIKRAQLTLGILQRAARAAKLRFHFETPCERFGEPGLELEYRGIAACKLPLQSRTAARELRALLRHALYADRHRIFGRAQRLAAD